MATIKVERVLEDAIMPTRAHKTDAGYDLYTPVNFTVHGLERKIIDIGIRIELSEGFEGQIRGRSGIAANKGVFVLNSPGTVDANYRNNIKTILFNTTRLPVYFKKGDRISQIVIKRIPEITLVEGMVSVDTDRGIDGMGSSGD
jgi:dUTP pyrophosphatase